MTLASRYLPSIGLRGATERAGRRVSVAVATAALAAGLLAAVASPALAASARHARPLAGYGGGGGRAVFVQTDNPGGNEIVAYNRSGAGALTQTGVYPTGGLGGILAGSVVDHLASQGSLVFDRAEDTLLAVNAGSNTVSVFAVRGDQLSLRQVISSGGIFPVSIAVSGGLVYVLNALAGGNVEGFAARYGRLTPLIGSTRSLGLNPAAFPSTPTRQAR
jgi:hypothetical protein